MGKWQETAPSCDVSCAGVDGSDSHHPQLQTPLRYRAREGVIGTDGVPPLGGASLHFTLPATPGGNCYCHFEAEQTEAPRHGGPHLGSQSQQVELLLKLGAGTPGPSLNPMLPCLPPSMGGRRHRQQAHTSQPPCPPRPILCGIPGPFGSRRSLSS